MGKVTQSLGLILHLMQRDSMSHHKESVSHTSPPPSLLTSVPNKKPPGSFPSLLHISGSPSQALARSRLDQRSCATVGTRQAPDWRSDFISTVCHGGLHQLCETGQARPAQVLPGSEGELHCLRSPAHPAVQAPCSIVTSSVQNVQERDFNGGNRPTKTCQALP